MSQGAMKPNQALLDQLGGIDAGQLKGLSRKQMDQLRENMREQAQKMQQAGGEGQQGEGQGDGGGDWMDELLQGDGQGQGQGQGEGQGDGEGEGPGKGGLGRGPGTSPDVLGEKSGELKTGDMEGLESRDLSDTLPGDLLQLQDGEHQVDDSQRGLRVGGEVDDLGEGGELIWKVAPDLSPAEKKALREFFK